MGRYVAGLQVQRVKIKKKKLIIKRDHIVFQKLQKFKVNTSPKSLFRNVSGADRGNCAIFRTA